MKLPKHKFAVVVDKAKRRLENSLTEALKPDKSAAEAIRLRKI